MSNGDPPVSGSPYIIICATRINIVAAVGTADMIKAASDGAAQLVSFMQLYYKHFKVEDCVPISTLQHELMDYLLDRVELSSEQVDEKIKVMVQEMYALEKKYQ